MKKNPVDGHQQDLKFTTKHLVQIRGKKWVYTAPDGSLIKKFPDVTYGGLCHCSLPSKSTASAHKHKTVDEIWYCIQGKGEVWRKQGEARNYSS